MNAAKSHLRQIESIVVMAYKRALGLPKNSSNKVCWKFSNQPSFRARVLQTCDKYLCRSSALGKSRILNKINYIWDQYKSGKFSSNNLPLLVSRWQVVEPLTKSLYKSKIHPFFTFPLKENFKFSDFGFSSGWIAKDSNDPDKIFNQLINYYLNTKILSKYKTLINYIKYI